ncbi:MAG: DoxX family protein [Bacteroidetes bacterium]|nr:MAG: DoxX family protein [Bacteroidota bacterium]
MAALYAVAGLAHFVIPGFYVSVMPDWLPSPGVWNVIAGIAEIKLAALLLPAATRKVAATLIILMLIVFFAAIHVPMAIAFGMAGHPLFWLMLLRLPLQFLLIAWAYKVGDAHFEAVKVA